MSHSATPLSAREVADLITTHPRWRRRLLRFRVPQEAIEEVVIAQHLKSRGYIGAIDRIKYNGARRYGFNPLLWIALINLIITIWKLLRDEGYAV